MAHHAHSAQVGQYAVAKCGYPREDQAKGGGEGEGEVKYDGGGDLELRDRLFELWGECHGCAGCEE